MNPLIQAAVALATPLVEWLLPELLKMHDDGKSQRAMLIHFKRRAGEVLHDRIVNETRKL